MRFPWSDPAGGLLDHRQARNQRRTIEVTRPNRSLYQPGLVKRCSIKSEPPAWLKTGHHLGDSAMLCTRSISSALSQG